MRGKKLSLLMLMYEFMKDFKSLTETVGATVWHPQFHTATLPLSCIKAEF